MPANPNWPRWVKASFARHLRAVGAALDLPAIIEGLDDRDTSQRQAQEKTEITIHGYSSSELNGEHEITTAVTVLVAVNKQRNANAYTVQDIAGAYVTALDQCIEVKQYQPGNDTPALVGILTPRNDGGNKIVAEEVKPTTGEQLTHVVITALYTGFFSSGV